MTTIYDVPINDLLAKASEELKKNDAISPPEWAPFVKTGAHKERPPSDKDWWYMRAAAVLRKTSVLGPIGVEKLRTKFGGARNRGVRPEQFRKGSGNILRKILQQLEAAGFVRKSKARPGRIITAQGQSLLDKAAATVAKA